MRLNRHGSELGCVQLGHGFFRVFADRIFAARNGNRQRHSLRRVIAFQVYDLAINIVAGGGLQLVTPYGNELDFQIIEHDRRITIIRDNYAHREKPFSLVIDLEDFGLVRQVEGVNGNGDFFVVVHLMRRIGLGMSGGRRIEHRLGIAAPHQRDGQKKRNDGNVDLHRPDYGPRSRFSQLPRHRIECTFFMYIAYSLLLALALLLSLPWWIFQVLRSGKYRVGLAERLGWPPRRLKDAAKPGAIWVHAVSVGEVLAVTNLVRELQAAFPKIPVVISTTTLTGQYLARGRFGESSAFFLPIDLGFALRRYFDLLQPRLVVLAETELWPNLLDLMAKRGAAIAVVNARVSDRSFPRYRRFRWFFRPVLSKIDLLLAQTEEDARRLIEIGASPGRVRVSGNLKFDVRPGATASIVEELREAFPQDMPVIVCGSTTEGEEELLLKAFQEVAREYPAAVMVLAPRHPERFDGVADLLTTMGVSFARRSTWVAGRRIAAGVFLLDSVGELAGVYALAR